MPLNDWVFWVALTLFGTGLFLIVEHKTWGLILTTVGGVGLLYTIRDHVQTGLGIVLSLRKLWVAVLYVVMLYIALKVFFYVRQLRTDLDTYVMPRVMTAKQADALRDFLLHHQPHSVTVKVNQLDQEATAYCNQLSGALKQAEWNVQTSYADPDPHTQTPGLRIQELGVNARPKDMQGVTLLQQAFQAARIRIDGSGAVGAGEYKLLIVVGRRPLALRAPLFKLLIVQRIMRKWMWRSLFPILLLALFRFFR
jgi:hypothetical protein